MLKYNMMKKCNLHIKSLLYIMLWGGVLGATSCTINSEDVPLSTLVAKEQERIDQAAQSIQTAIDNNIPGIVCWGDSLTFGGYPTHISESIEVEIFSGFDPRDYINEDLYPYINSEYNFNIPVVNMGASGEGSLTICGRNGAIPFVLSEPLTIPETRNRVMVRLESCLNGLSVAPLRQRDVGVNPVTIGGIEGTLSIEQDSIYSSDYEYYFERSTRGEAVTLAKGTEIITSGSKDYQDHYLVIFIGQNDGVFEPATLIERQEAIINHQDENGDKYVIVGLHTGTAESRRDLEAAMVEHWGDKYINLREYMVTQALEDAGITPTEEDEAALAVGSCPPSLLSDVVHFTPETNVLVGNLIFQKMMDLGYFDPVITAVNDAMEALQ